MFPRYPSQFLTPHHGEVFAAERNGLRADEKCFRGATFFSVLGFGYLAFHGGTNPVSTGLFLCSLVLCVAGERIRRSYEAAERQQPDTVPLLGAHLTAALNSDAASPDGVEQGARTVVSSSSTPTTPLTSVKPKQP